MNSETVISSKEYMDLIRNLYEKVKKSKYNPDFVLAVLRGGYYPAKVISEKISESNRKRGKYIEIGISSYDGRKQKEFNLYKDVKEEIVRGKKILVVDDLVDSGKTLKYVKELLENKGVSDIKTAVIFRKPQSKTNPDFYVKETKDWIEFPYERGTLKKFLFEIYFHFVN